MCETLSYCQQIPKSLKTGATRGNDFWQPSPRHRRTGRSLRGQLAVCPRNRRRRKSHGAPAAVPAAPDSHAQRSFLAAGARAPYNNGEGERARGAVARRHCSLGLAASARAGAKGNCPARSFHNCALSGGLFRYGAARKAGRCFSAGRRRSLIRGTRERRAERVPITFEPLGYGKVQSPD